LWSKTTIETFFKIISETSIKLLSKTSIRFISKTSFPSFQTTTIKMMIWLSMIKLSMIMMIVFSFMPFHDSLNKCIHTWMPRCEIHHMCLYLRGFLNTSLTKHAYIFAYAFSYFLMIRHQPFYCRLMILFPLYMGYFMIYKSLFIIHCSRNCFFKHINWMS